MSSSSLYRSSGILLHPTSLPSAYGIGDLGDEARAFIDFLHAAHQTLWQVLPLTPTGYGDSPYQSISAFAGNPLLIDLRALAADGWLPHSDPPDRPFAHERVNFETARAMKTDLLNHAFENFRLQHSPATNFEFNEFCAHTAWWLDDYAMFRALKAAHGNGEWTAWERELAFRE